MVKGKALSITYAVSSSKLFREMRLIDLASADVFSYSKKKRIAVSFSMMDWAPAKLTDRRLPNREFDDVAYFWLRCGSCLAMIAEKHRSSAVIIPFEFDRFIKIRHISVSFRTLHVSEMHQSIFQVLLSIGDGKADRACATSSNDKLPSISSIIDVLIFFLVPERDDDADDD